MIIKHHAAAKGAHIGPHIGASLSDYGGGNRSAATIEAIETGPKQIPSPGAGAAAQPGGAGIQAGIGFTPQGGNPIQSDNFGLYSTGLSPLNKL